MKNTYVEFNFMLFSIIIFIILSFVYFYMRNNNIVENYNNNDTRDNQEYLPHYNPYTITQVNKNNILLLKQELNDMQQSITELENNNIKIQNSISANTSQNKELQDNLKTVTDKIKQNQATLKKKQDDLYDYIYNHNNYYGNYHLIDKTGLPFVRLKR